MYQLPNLRKLFKDVVLRLKLFIVRSGKVVVPFCVLLGSLQAALQSGVHMTHSLQYFLWQLWEHVLHPLFLPLGIRLENWPAAVALFTGTMAKEIVIATLNTLYTELPPITGQYLQMIPQPELYTGVLGHFLNRTDITMSAVSTQNFIGAFGGGLAAYSYLLFVLLYIPCISTLAIIRQEVGRFWQWFAFLWSLILAYSVSSLCYQVLSWSLHPLQSILWCISLFIAWSIILLFFKKWRPRHVSSH